MFSKNLIKYIHQVIKIALVLVVISDIAYAEVYRDIERKYHVQLAHRTVKKIDYLPFTFIKDGCFARALYIGMELIAKGIPVNNQYIVGKLMPEGAKWGWHVAPLVIGPDEKEYIFDPSMAEKPLVKDKWVELSNPVKKPELWVAPVSNYSKDRAYQLQQKQVPGYDHETMIEDYTNIPGFEIKDIANACRVAYHNIGEEDLSKDLIKEKRKKLIYRTKFLLHKLRDLDMIAKDAKIKSCKTGKVVEG